MNTSEYLLLFLTSKILITALISLLILYFSLRSKQTTMLYVCIGVFFLAAYLLRVMIPGDSTLGILHYVNLIPFLSVYPVFKFFFNVNIFGLPVAMSTVFFTITSLLLLLIIICISYGFIRGSYISSWSLRCSWRLTFHQFTKMNFTIKII